ncbi:MAG: CrcB family protein [Corynebacterium sp.]|nr:CrcB family protein [Corynebacterium sp.]
MPENGSTTDLYRDFLLVGTGAALGALIRYGLNLWIPGLWGILLINALACAIMGIKKHGPFIGTGLLGGMSTFSTYIAFAHGNLLYAVLTIIVSVAAYLITNTYVAPYLANSTEEAEQ